MFHKFAKSHFDCDLQRFQTECECAYLCFFFFFRSNNIFPSFRILSSPLPDHRYFNQRPGKGRDESLPGIFESPSCVVPLLPLVPCTWQDGRLAIKRRLIFVCQKNVPILQPPEPARQRHMAMCVCMYALTHTVI